MPVTGRKSRFDAVMATDPDLHGGCPITPPGCSPLKLTFDPTFTMAPDTGRVTRRILVVDDDRPSREGLSAALAREGHSVDAAGDAWQAMIRLRAQSFD